MAITILGSFYNDVIEGKVDSVSAFLNVVKTISAFYVLWRSSFSNAGLDDVYRTFFKGSSKNGADTHVWIEKRSFDLNDVKQYFKKALSVKGIANKESWLEKAKHYSRYDTSYSLSKFILYVSAHDTIVDPTTPGAMKLATPGSSSFLRLDKWRSVDLQHIEHIAPKDNKGDWDVGLYQATELYQSIGNLTLLPSDVNISASNKGWKEKLIYYRHLSEQDPDKLRELANKASSEGITLSDKTVKMLQASNYSTHILPVLSVGENDSWDASMVKLRSERMLNILWDRIANWAL